MIPGFRTYATLTTAILIATLPLAAGAQPAASTGQARPAIGNTQAGTKQSAIQRRLENQRDRIQKGVRNGQLTRSEYMHDMSRVQSAARTYRTDLRQNNGQLNRQDRQGVRSALRKSSEGIHYTRHNTKVPGPQ
jgi:hypothetical protein